MGASPTLTVESVFIWAVMTGRWLITQNTVVRQAGTPWGSDLMTPNLADQARTGIGGTLTANLGAWDRSRGRKLGW